MVSRRNHKASSHQKMKLKASAPAVSVAERSLLLDAPTPVRLQLGAFERVNLVLVGCGGTGSHLASGLCALACELRERNIAVQLIFVDPDRVELKNVGRQLFTRADIGKPKAQVLAQRVMQAFGVVVNVYVAPIQKSVGRIETAQGPLTLLIGAVDNPAARAYLCELVAKAGGAVWWLDCGNENHSGQIALGNCTEAAQLKNSVQLGMTQQLPAPNLVYPDLLETPRVKKSKNASCAELTAAGEQGLMANRLVAAWALSLLNDFLIAREIQYFALAFNARTGGATPHYLDVPTLARVTGLGEKQLQGAT